MKMLLLPCLACLSVVVFAGCGRAPVSPRQAQATPLPTATPSAAERMNKENAEAARATGDFLKEKGAQLKASLRQAGDQLGIDKENLQKQLEQARRDYQPQIDELKRRAAAAGEEARPELNRQIANLEDQRKKADVKLDQLKSATGDAWKTFKARWKEEQSQKIPAPTAAPTP